MPLPVKFGIKSCVRLPAAVVPVEGVKVTFALEDGKRVFRVQSGRTSIPVMSADVAVNPSSATVKSPVPFETTKNPVPVKFPEVTIAKYVFGCVVTAYWKELAEKVALGHTSVALPPDADTELTAPANSTGRNNWGTTIVSDPAAKVWFT